MGDLRWKTKRLYILHLSDGMSAHLAKTILMSSSGEKGFAYLRLGGRWARFSPPPIHRPQRTFSQRIKIHTWMFRSVKMCLHIMIFCKVNYCCLISDFSLDARLLILSSPSVAPTPPSTLLLFFSKWRLIIDLAFSLFSSLFPLQRLPTYLPEQCCSRRALKDRLDCLEILISHFFLHTSCSMCFFSVTHTIPPQMILFICLYHLQLQLPPLFLRCLGWRIISALLLYIFLVCPCVFVKNVATVYVCVCVCVCVCVW